MSEASCTQLIATIKELQVAPNAQVQVSGIDQPHAGVQPQPVAAWTPGLHLQQHCWLPRRQQLQLKLQTLAQLGSAQHREVMPLPASHVQSTLRHVASAHYQ